MNIRTHVERAIEEGFAANITIKDGKAGTLFHDEAEFIPFDDLGYNSEYGYFRLSLLPDVRSDCTNEPLFSVRRVEDVPYTLFALYSMDGTSYALGNRWQVAEAAEVLKGFLNSPTTEETIDLSSFADMPSAAAVEYIIERGWPPSRARNTLLVQASRGCVPGATKDSNGHHWLFSRIGLDAWLENAKPYKAKD